MTEHIARLKKGSENFEILVDPDKAMEFRKKGGSIQDVLVFAKVFSDAKKGLAASEQRMKSLFGSADPYIVATEIVTKGEIQLSTEYRAKLREQKRKRLIDVIHRNAIDPKTNAPHPITRIEKALEEAKVRIDETKEAEEQLESVLDKINAILPIKFSVKEIRIAIPRAFAGKASGIIRAYGKILKETWDSQGNWQGSIEIPGGLELEFYDKINKLTHGDNTIDVVKNS